MRSGAIGACLFAAIVLAACHAGPNYKTPPPPPKSDGALLSADAALESQEDAPDAWWQLYDDVRLNGLVEEALKVNRNLAVAEANFAAARAVVAAAKAGRYPQTQVTVGGTYGRDATTDEILELGGHPPATLWLLEDVLEVGYEVDLFGRVHRSIEAADANAAASAAARDAVKVVTAAETARAYAQVCALGEQLTVARHSLEVVSHEADITVHRHDAGANSDFDVARAQALVFQVRASLGPLEGQQRAALFELAALLGRTPADAPQDLSTCSKVPRLKALIPVGDGARLLRRRPDVRQAERRLAASTAQIGVATADLYPTIRIGGFIGSVGSELSDLTADRGLTWGIGPAVTWNFPNQLAPRARIRQAKAFQAAALANFDGTVLSALKETEQALTLYHAALRSYQELLGAQERIHSAFDMAHNQFLAGAASNLDLLTTEQTLVTIDSAVASADAGLIQDQIAVFKALGGGWHNSPGPGR